MQDVVAVQSLPHHQSCVCWTSESNEHTGPAHNSLRAAATHEMKSRPNPNEIEYQNSRVGLNPTPKTDEDGDDGDGYNDKD